MKYVKYLIFNSFLIQLCASNLAAQNVAVEDGFDLLEDNELVVDADFGVLSNDRFGQGNILAVLDKAPTNGSIEFRNDGSFRYLPNPNFNGEDSFRYSFESQPSSIEFVVDESKSEVDFSATLTAVGISQTRSDSSGLEGSLQIELAPTQPPFDSIRILNGSLTLSDDISLRYRFLLFVTAEVSADGGDIVMELIEPGPESSVGVDGSFKQVGNDFQITGNAEVNASLDLGVPDGAQSFDTIIEDIDLEGKITESGNNLILNLPVSFQGEFEIGGNTIELDLNGTLVATAPKPKPVISNVADVVLEIDPTNDAPNLNPDYFLAEGGVVSDDFTSNDFDVDGDSIIPSIEKSPLKGVITSNINGKFNYSANVGASGIDSFVYSVPNSGGNVSRELFSYSSEWQYIDDGKNPPNNWNKIITEEKIWGKNGIAPLGYGSTSFNTNINYGPNESNKYVTSYFRKEFRLQSPSSIDSFVIDIDRTDSVAIYLNGEEVFRDDFLSPNAGYRTLASNDLIEEERNISISVPISLLRPGINSVCVELHKSSRSSNDLKFDMRAVAIMPPFTEIVSTGEVWKYLSDNNPLLELWKFLDFDDSSWTNALSPLGYGEDGISGVIDFGDDPNQKPVTAYFRKKFFFSANNDVVGSKVILRKDDGAAVYLNGVEIARDNLQDDAGFDTLATSTISGESELKSSEFIFDSTLLNEGENILAVEVHQSSRSSSDLFFDLKLLVSSETIREFVFIQLPATLSNDTDNDGYNDSTEIFFGSDEKDIESTPSFEARIVKRSNDLEILFPGRKGEGYQLQISNDLNNWMSMEKIILGDGSIINELVPLKGVSKRYYRVIK